MTWVDTNVHLEGIPSDPKHVLDRAKDANVSVIATGMHPEQWKWLATQCPALRAYGLHPSYIDTSTNLDGLIDYLEADKSAHLGEIGLDYRGSQTNRETQYRVFLDQLEIAKQYQRAIIIHAVRAHTDVLKALKKYSVDRFVVHAFTGSRAIAEQYLALGGYLSLGGHLLRTPVPKVANYCADLPLAKLLIETNAPDLAPNGFVNFEPSYLPLIGQALSNLLGLPVNHLADQLCANASSLFDHDFAQSG